MPVKNATGEQVRLVASYDGVRYRAYPAGDKPVSETLTALNFPANNAANSDIRFLFNGANLPARVGSTILWASCSNASITGYVTHIWFSHNVGAFQADNYEVGGHPYPANSASYDAGNGQVDVGAQGGGSGTTHYMELAGLSARDQIAIPGSAVLATKDGTTWKRHALQTTSITGGTEIRHRYWPDVVGAPTNYFERIVSATGFPTPSNPAFYWGTSDWRSGLGGGGATANDETPNGKIRGLVIVPSGALTDTQLGGISACDTNAAVLAYLAGQGLSSWYVNMNPTPTDVNDKSGAGHNPTWANALRPSLFTL